MSHTEIHIRPATPADFAIIADYNARLAFETEGKHLAPEVVCAGVLGLFEETSRGKYWLAEANGRVVGQLLITSEWSDWRNGEIWWLQSVYVHPEFRSRGVFRRLFAHVRGLVESTPQVIGLRLYIEQENENAHRVYSQLGLLPTGYRVMEWFAGSEEP